jgi:hypothetical protein
MKDPQVKIRVHVHYGGQRIGLGLLHQMNLWLLKRRQCFETSSSRGFRRIIHLTYRQGINTMTICPKAIQVTATQACHRFV